MDKEEREIRRRSEKAVMTATSTVSGKIRYTPLAEFDSCGNIIPGLAPLEEPIPLQSLHLKNPNPCVREFGEGPKDSHCDDCQHASASVEITQVQKPRSGATEVKKDCLICAFRGETVLPLATLQYGWHGCSRFKRRVGELKKSDAPEFVPKLDFGG